MTADLEALRLEAQSSVDESATKPPADPGPEGEQWAALPKEGKFQILLRSEEHTSELQSP